MINFSQHLAITYGPDGIRANTLTPARMLTEKKYEMLANNPAAVRTQKFAYPMGSPAPARTGGRGHVVFGFRRVGRHHRPQPDCGTPATRHSAPAA